LAQEVLAETAGPGDLEYEGAHGAGAGGVGGDDQQTKTALQLLAETQEQKEQLDRRCEEKDREVGLHSHFLGFTTHSFHSPTPQSPLYRLPPCDARWPETSRNPSRQEPPAAHLRPGKPNR